MRAGHTHKSGLERRLFALRAEVSAVCDAEDPAQMKEVLVKVEQALRAAEMHLASGRLHTGEHPAAATLDAHTLEYVKAAWSEEEHHIASSLAHIDRTTSSTSLSLSPSSHRLSRHDRLKEVSPEIISLLERAGCFDFDALAFSSIDELKSMRCPITVLGLHLLSHGPNGDLITCMHDAGRFEDPPRLMRNRVASFFEKLDAKYKVDALYHGSAHAVDVMSTSQWFLSSKLGQSQCNPLECFMMLVASAMHDVGHMGRNNMFYTKTMHPLAIEYNDKSVLENMHLATSFGVMSEEEDCNWFKLLKEQAFVRAGLINMVLATDPSKHNEKMAQLQGVADRLKEDPDLMSPTKERPSDKDMQQYRDDKFCLLGNLLHAADVSNPTKPEHMMLAWTGRLLQEFWAQGDEEASLGVPISPLCDRSAGMASIPKGQIGFVSFVIQPFFKVIAGPIEETKEALDQLAKNVEFWKGKDAEKATYDKLFGEK